jgi:hypothetical protein
VNVNWTAVHGLLLQLVRSNPDKQQPNSSCQEEDDPVGRIFLSDLLARNPPVNCVDAALQAFPDAVSPNHPVAFFTASSNASQQAIAQMMQHVIQRSQEKEGDRHSVECPYPWIFLPYISVEAAQVMLKMYPQGVWATSSTPFLTCDSRSYCPLDYILFAPAMTSRRHFDEAMWLKFKLILVSAGIRDHSQIVGCEISPVHTLLDRILSCSGKMTTEKDLLAFVFFCFLETLYAELLCLPSLCWLLIICP